MHHGPGTVRARRTLQDRKQAVTLRVEVDVPQLADADRRAVLDAAAHLSHCTDPAQFAVEGAQQLLGLLDAEVAAFTYLDLGSRRAQVLITPDVPQYSGPAAHASTTLHDNPLPAYWASSEAPAPSRVSDHLPARAWRATATYTEVLGPMGTPHMLGVPLLDAARGGPSCAVSRSGRDFSARDVDVATALQAALLVVYTRVSAAVGWCSPRPVLARELTAREVEVLTLLSEGSTAWAIARRLQVSPATVRKHLEHLYRKLEVQDRLSAVNRGRELGLVQAALSPSAGRDRGTGVPRQSVPNSIAAASSALSSSPSTAGLSRITSAPPTSIAPNSVPCSTST